MHGKVLHVDADKCTGCLLCVVACALAHAGNVEHPDSAHIRLWKSDRAEVFMPLTCHHCETASCANACPTKACHRDSDGSRVVIDAEKCIGCRTCVVACPFEHAHYDTLAGVSSKCDYCDGRPECVRICETGALTYVESVENSITKRQSTGAVLAFGRRSLRPATK
jgi:anaerobic carbon-monoxide dehydrogenase iron sulfur subunit